MLEMDPLAKRCHASDPKPRHPILRQIGAFVHLKMTYGYQSCTSTP